MKIGIELAWEYSFLTIDSGRSDLWFARLQAMGAEGWEAFAANNSTLWLKRRVVLGGSNE